LALAAGSVLRVRVPYRRRRKEARRA
jgi:hypothetical protein